MQFHSCEMSRIGKSIETGSRSVSSQGWEQGAGDQRVMVSGSRVSLGSNENILKLIIDDRWMCNPVVIKSQPLNFVLQWVNCVAYSLYLSKTVLKWLQWCQGQTLKVSQGCLLLGHQSLAKDFLFLLTNDDAHQGGKYKIGMCLPQIFSY